MIDRKFSPIFLFGDLIIQRGLILTDIEPLPLSYFLFNRLFVGGGGVVKDAEPDCMAFPLCLRKHPVFVIFGVGDLRVVLCHPHKHIDAFPHIDGRAVQKDTVNPRMLELLRKPFALQAVVNALFKLIHYFFTPKTDFL